MKEIKNGVFKTTTDQPQDIYVIGDIHGDFQCLIHCLVDLCKCVYISDIKYNEITKCTIEHLEWETNNNSVVIFCGDLIHRKRYPDNVLDDECSDVYIILLLLGLKKRAQMFGGDVLIASGNHEIMNLTMPKDKTYTSDMNYETNLKFFTNPQFVENYIDNTYAWIVVDDILIAHGGLCSDYLRFLDGQNIFEQKMYMNGGGKYMMYGGTKVRFGHDVVSFINDEYRKVFKDFIKNKSNMGKNSMGYKLFIEYEFDDKKTHNMFWCREWGYSGVSCEEFQNTIDKVNCEKMIIAHCPQFYPEDKAKMINFECKDENGHYKISRIDVGMSRCFENNKTVGFLKALGTHYNRKMSILKLGYDDILNKYFFDYSCVCTYKMSCIQYLLLKYGKTKNEWEQKNITSDWKGFEYVEPMIKEIEQGTIPNFPSENGDENTKPLNGFNILLSLLYPLYVRTPELRSVQQYKILSGN